MSKKFEHTGNGVEFVGLSGTVYRAAPGDVVEFVDGDEVAVEGNSEWAALAVEPSKTNKKESK